ncbi:MAG: hypothetical protein F4114_02520 [Rhodospirillaceae bacterium]|nr:hypothetical protein [Rhodospirillaceae bacterium]MYB15340.1 hypothetical protein [Rhodospirillaceae bacterium]MYI47948.1 hypothetical protein [Rhodospirillaceae bacterium]
MPISERQITNAIHSGICAANEKYEKWSKGCWVTDSGVEGLMTAEIAEAINKKQSKDESLELEVAFKHIRTCSTANIARGRRPTALNENNRADIVLFNCDYQPTCVIEVKRSWDYNNCWLDLQRICALVDRYSSNKQGYLDNGFLAMLIAKREGRINSPEGIFENYLKKVKEYVEYEFNNASRKISIHHKLARTLPNYYQKEYGNWQAWSLIIQISRAE